MGNSLTSRSSGEPHRLEASIFRKGEHSRRGVKVGGLKVSVQEAPEYPDEPELENDLNVSFGYHCRTYSDADGGALSKSFGESSSSALGGSTPDSFKDMSPLGVAPYPGAGDGWKRSRKHGSFSSLAGAALGANTTLGNTTLAHGSVPNLDSPRTFRKLGSGALSVSSFATSTHSSSSSSGSGPFAFKTASSPSPPLPSILDDAGWPRGGGGPHSSSAPSLAKHASFLHASDLQMAGGCAGEDRVMAVCSEENGWLFCGVYDGFNGRDAADYLAANLYENICMQLRLLEWRLQHDQGGAEAPLVGGRIWQHTCSHAGSRGGADEGDADTADVLASVDINVTGLELESKAGKKAGREGGVSIPPASSTYGRCATAPKAIGGLPRIAEGKRRSVSPWNGGRPGTSLARSLSDVAFPRSPKRAAAPTRCEACVAAETLRAQGGPDGAAASSRGEGGGLGAGAGVSEEAFRGGVVRGLVKALAATESDFMDTVELEMDERPDLVMVGSCVLACLMHGQHLYALNLGDSRAVLATRGGGSGVGCCDEGCCAVQLTQDHKVADVDERDRLLGEHPDDDTTIWNGRVKGKLAVTRAFGAGYLKKKKMNDALMGILRVSDLESPPYISTQPWVHVHAVTPADRFVLLSSDGLNDFYTNQEAVHEVCRFTAAHPDADPAKHLLEQLLARAADKAGLTVEQLKNVPSGRRRKYHDDITIVIIMLQPGNMKTSSASTLNGHV